MELETTQIGASYTFGLNLKDDVANYADIKVVLRTNDASETVLATFAKNATGDQIPIRIDSVNTKLFWCDTPHTVTENAIETAYEVYFEAVIPDVNYVGGIRKDVASSRLIRFAK